MNDLTGIRIISSRHQTLNHSVSLSLSLSLSSPLSQHLMRFFQAAFCSDTFLHFSTSSSFFQVFFRHSLPSCSSQLIHPLCLTIVAFFILLLFLFCFIYLYFRSLYLFFTNFSPICESFQILLRFIYFSFSYSAFSFPFFNVYLLHSLIHARSESGLSKLPSRRRPKVS